MDTAGVKAEFFCHTCQRHKPLAQRSERKSGGHYKCLQCVNKFERKRR